MCCQLWRSKQWWLRSTAMADTIWLWIGLNGCQCWHYCTLSHSCLSSQPMLTNTTGLSPSLPLSLTLTTTADPLRPLPSLPYLKYVTQNRLSMRPIRPMRAPLSLSLSAILQSTHCRHIEAGQWVPRFNCIAHLSPHLLHHNCIITTVRWPSLGRLSTTDHRQIGNITTRLACISPIGSI